MPLDTQPLIHKPDIVVADPSPLIHLSQVGALHLLHEVGGAVVIVDMGRRKICPNKTLPCSKHGWRTN